MSIVQGFVGDGLYKCPEGFANGETENVFIESPRGPTGQKLICHSGKCQKSDCNFNLRCYLEHYGAPPLKFPSELSWVSPLDK